MLNKSHLKNHNIIQLFILISKTTQFTFTNISLIKVIINNTIPTQITQIHVPFNLLLSNITILIQIIFKKRTTKLEPTSIFTNIHNNLY